MRFQTKLITSFVAALLILAIISIVSYRKTSEEDRDQEWVAHTHLVLEKLDFLLIDLVDAEARQRSYIVTGDRSHLVPYESAVQQVSQNMHDFEALTQDNPTQQRAAVELNSLIKTKLSELRDGIAARDKTGLSGGTESIQSATEKKTMEQIRALISRMREVERTLLTERLNAAKSSSGTTKVAILVGNALAFILLSAAAFTIHSESVKRQKFERELLRSEERFRTLVSGVKDYAIIMLDAEGHVVSWNAGAEAIKGYRTDEIVGRHFSCFYLPEDVERGKPEHELESAVRDQRFEDEGWRVRKDGSRFWANVVVTRLLDDKGNVTGFSKITRDITERRQAEEEIKLRNAQLEVANKELEAFSYSVSHDLRSPLRSIDGFSQALLEDYGTQLDLEGQDCLERIRAATKRMGMLIDDLLNLSRMTRAEIRRTEIDLTKMSQSVIEDLQKQAPERNVRVVVAPGLKVEADARLMRVVLENLLGNAWKFTSKQADPWIEIGASKQNGHQEYFIRDNGAGFDQAYADRLFGAFQRLHGMAEYPGTGIGLATVQRILHRHGGNVRAEGKVNQGATFYFSFD